MAAPAPRSPDAPSADAAPPPWERGLVAALFLLGALAAAVPVVGIPGAVLTLIGGLSLPTRGGRVARVGLVAVGAAALGSVIGVARFATGQGLLGMVTGGRSVAAHTALWKLREIVIAEDALRRGGQWDPDGDRVGSAASIGALSGLSPLRPGAPPLDPPVLSQVFRNLVETTAGPAARVEGYLFLVCLPGRDGALTARPEAPIDDEAAERRYVAYAWPADPRSGMTAVFFADEHERLLVRLPPAGAKAPHAGPDGAPPCDAALGPDAAEYAPWKGKAPRQSLPGDR